MAENQGKRSVHPAQSSPSRRRALSGNNHPETGFVLPQRQVSRYPQVKGKVVEYVEFSIESDGKIISINFRDNTCLNLAIETDFTLKADYSDWKNGEQRVVRRWKPVRSS